jgi:hypothetical protein
MRAHTSRSEHEAGPIHLGGSFEAGRCSVHATEIRVGVCGFPEKENPEEHRRDKGNYQEH